MFTYLKFENLTTRAIALGEAKRGNRRFPAKEWFEASHFTFGAERDIDEANMPGAMVYQQVRAIVLPDAPWDPENERLRA